MKIYLVGGAVRDQLLGLPVHEKDWVVVGSTPAEMQALGYKPIGKDFPVFLHPETHEEYALARTEKKIGKGYKGFTFYTSPEVTLEEDLARRDLTINAIAKDDAGNETDPFFGRKDLSQKILRHVSSAFVEDPVRILRVARFAARFSDFTIHPETEALMKKMVLSGEVDALVAERVWRECERALSEKNPLRFFSILEECGASARLWPEFHLTEDVKKSLKQAVEGSLQSEIRLAALWHALPKEVIEQYAERFRIPTPHRELAVLVSQYFSEFPVIQKNNAENILEVLQKCDAFRRPERFEMFLETCGACSTDAAAAKKLSERWGMAFQAAVSVSTVALQEQGVRGAEFGKALTSLRLSAILSLPWK